MAHQLVHMVERLPLHPYGWFTWQQVGQLQKLVLDHGAWWFVARCCYALPGMGRISRRIADLAQGIFERSRKSGSCPETPQLEALSHRFNRGSTFHIVCLGWVLFRADDLNIAGKILLKLAQAPQALAHFSTSQLAVLQIRDPIIFPSLVLIVLL